MESENTDTHAMKPIEKSPNKNIIGALIVAVAIAAFFAGMYFSNSNSETISKAELNEVVQRLESKIEQIQLPSGQQAPTVSISLDDDPIRGDANADIVILEFSDFQCPFCARFHVETLPSLMEEYINTGKVKLVYRDFPIQSIHPNAMPASVAAECANDQGKYWEYHDMLFERQSSWSQLETTAAITAFSQFATELELEQNEFESCLVSGKYIDEIRKDLTDGRDYGVSGTPGFFVGNEKIGFVEISGAQPFESFKSIIDVQLNS